MTSLPFALPAFIGSAVCLLMAWQVRRRARNSRWRRPGARAFAGFCLAVAVWCFGSGMEVLSASLDTLRGWVRVQYLGLPWTPALWLLFVARYAGTAESLRGWRHLRPLLWLPPLGVALLAWTNPWHGLVWPRVWAEPGAERLLVHFEHGPAFWGGTVLFGYLYSSAALAALVRALLHSAAAARTRLALLLGVTLLPLACNLLYLWGPGPLAVFDPTPVGLALGALLVAVAVFGDRLFDQVPVAHGAVVRGLKDGVVVLDPDLRLVDLNPAARRLLALGDGPLPGVPLARLAPGMALPDERGGRWRAGPQAPLLEVSGGELQGGRGFLLTLRDITEAHAQQLRRERLQAAAERSARASALLADVERLLLTRDDLDAFLPELARRATAEPIFGIAAVAVCERRPDGPRARCYGPDGARCAARERELAAGEGVPAAARHPLTLDGRDWGAVAFDRRPDAAGDRFDEQLAEQLAAVVELALARQARRERQARQLAKMDALVRTGQALRSLASRDEVVARSLATLLDATRAERCSLLLWDAERAALLPALPAVAPEAAGGSAEDDAHWWPALRVFEEQRTLQWGSDPLAWPEGRLPRAAFMGTPLRDREGVVVGVLAASLPAPLTPPPTTPPTNAAETATADGERFTPDETNFLEAVAQACGNALVRLELLEHSQAQTRTYRELYDRALESERRFRLLAENMTDVVCLHDARGRYRYLSPSSAAVIGHAPEALLGHSPLELVHPDDRTALRERVVGPLRAGETVRGFCYRVRHRDGHYGWLELNAQPLRAADGSLRGFVSASRDVSERKRIEAELVRGALHDDLTGLPNRALLTDRIAQSLQRLERGGGRFALLFLDLDRFKLINDSFGHHAGDALLREIAARLYRCVRAADTVARLGGDEFCLLLENVSEDGDATGTADRVLAALGEPFTLEGHEVYSGASIGIAFADTGYRQPQELLRDADIAMYSAKHGGKNRYAVFDRHMRQRVVAQLRLETDLHRALERDELFLHYQPVFRLAAPPADPPTGPSTDPPTDPPTGLLADRRLAGFEALVRWRHPQRGLVSPGEFVPLAEETGLILEIDRWVLRTACAQLARWRRGSGAQLWMSVNLSAGQLARVDLADELAALLRHHDLPGDCVKLEVTEQALMADARGAAETLGALRRVGVGVQVDNFGTGWSSLAFLQRLPIDALKIDRSFVAAVGGADHHREIVTSIVALARSLGLAVVAEGVELPQQLELLQQLGCDYAQGYHLARPQGVRAIESRFLAPRAALREGG